MDGWMDGWMDGCRPRAGQMRQGNLMSQVQQHNGIGFRGLGFRGLGFRV